MSGITAHLKARGTAVTAVAVLALAAGTGTALAVAPDPSAPPVVTIALDGDKVKLSGADGLKAGWITIKASTTTKPHSLWLFTPKPGAKPAGAEKAVQAMQAVQANEGQSPEAAAEGGPQQKPANNVATVEDTLVGLGGALVTPKRSATFSVNLPEGEVSIADLANGAEKAATPIAKLMLGDPGGAVRSAGNGSQVTIDEKAQIQAPDTLPRTGELRISNVGDKKWHFLELHKLQEGKGEKDVVAFFSGSGTSPFDPENALGTAPLSGGVEEYLDYDLPAGTYAFVDSWVDSATGTFNASQGAIRMVTLS
ncbi:MAG: hypothetical protein ACT4QG_19110 [Sporichthyaceae bacterium]